MEQFYSPMKAKMNEWNLFTAFTNVFKNKIQVKSIFLACITFLSLFLSGLNVSWGQITPTTWDFNANSTGWTGNITRTTATTACGSASMRRNMYVSLPTGNLVSPILPGINNGGTITLSYKYKVANWSANTVGTNPWGNFNVQYGPSATGPWTTFANVTNQTQNGTCITRTHTFTPPVGNVFIKWDCFWQSGDYYINFDDVVVSQGAVSNCSGTPNAGTAGISLSSGCAPTTTTLSASGLSVGGGISYQWFSSSTFGGTYAAIPGATTPTSTVTGGVGQTFYKLVSTCSSGGATNSSNIVSFNGVSCGSQNVPASGSNIVACGTSTLLYDNGGSGGSYANGSNGFTVLDNSGTSVINISGAFTYLETNWDYLRIYSGIGTGGTLLYTYSNSSGGTITPFSSPPGTSLTVQFTSDGSGNGAGFAMQVVYTGACAVCQGTPTPGNTLATLAALPIGSTTILSLQNFTIGQGVSYQWQTASSAAGPWTNISGATSATYSLTFSAMAWYQCVVTCAGSPGYSTPIQITQSACIPASSFGNSGAYYGVISNVVFGGMSHASGALSSPWYASYPTTTATTTVVAGSTQSLAITSFNYNIVGVWFDWNNNLVYENSEYVSVAPLSNAAFGTWTANASVLVPLNASPGLIGMRVRTNYYSYALGAGDACTTTSYGETKDYRITVVPPPITPAINASAFANCVNGVSLTPSLSAPVNEAFYWQISATGTNTSNAANPYTVFANGTYYLRAMNTLYNVWGTATSITVSSFPTVTAPTAIIGNNPSCPSASLTMGAAPSGTTYYWQGTNPVGFSTADVATNAYTATAIGTYYVRAQDAAGCWSDNTSQYISIYAPPTATTSVLSPVNCGANGLITFNVQGSGTIFFSDFSTPNLPAGTISAGNDFSANDNGNGRMRLTSSVGSRNGGVVIPNQTGLASNDFQIDFDFITTPGSGAPADGLSYSYGPDVVAIPTGTALDNTIVAPGATNPENGSGTKLKLSFDAYNNGVNLNGIYLMYNCPRVNPASTLSPAEGLYYYSNNTSWRGGATTHVTIKITSNGGNAFLSLWLNGIQVLNNAGIPASYLTEDKSTWKHAFTARTGGEWQGHYIDNLDVHYNINEYSIDGGTTWTTNNPVSAPVGTYNTMVRYIGINNGCSASAGIATVTAAPLLAGTATINGLAATSLCTGLPYTVNASGLSTGTGFTFQWQSSIDGGTNWVNEGTPSSSYSPLTGTASVNKQFRMKSTCVTDVYSVPVTLTVTPTQTFTLSAANNGIWCDGFAGARTITASNAALTYAWTPASFTGTGQMVTSTADPLSLTTYTVNGSANGCSYVQTIAVGLPFVNINSNISNFCGSGGAAVLTATSNATNATFSWASLTPTSTTSFVPNGATANVNVNATADFQVSIDSYNGNAACASVGYYSLGVYPLPTATLTAPNGVCPGTAAVINSGLTSGNFTATCTPFVNTPAPSSATYLVNGGVATVTQASGTLDDGGWSGIPVGFNFNFFGSTFNTINVGTNGVLQFGAYNAAALGDFTIGALPNTLDPLGAIYICANDLNTNQPANYIRYWTQGIAPNRRFIIEYSSYQYATPANSVRAKAILYETIGVVEIQGIEILSTNAKSIGVNNSTGTIGAAAPNCPAGTQNYWSARTNTIPASAPQAWRFTPPTNYTTVWTATVGTSTSTVASGTNIFSLNVAPPVTTTYSISYTNQTTGCANAPGSAQATMTVLGVTAPTGVVASSSVSSVCAGNLFNVSADYTGPAAGLAYQWQLSTDGGLTWLNAPGYINLTATFLQTVSTSYRLAITSCAGNPSYSTVVFVPINNDCFTVPASGSNAMTSCNGLLYDNGSFSGDYALNSNGYTVINPATPGYVVQVQGTQVTQSLYDILTIYDGNGTTGTSLYSASGTATIDPVSSSSGPLTVQFISDAFTVYSGFALSTSCVPPAPVITANLINSNLCIGSSATLTAALSSQLPSNFAGTVYWFAGSCGTTGQVGTGLTLTVSPTTTTTYYARLFDGTTWSACQPYTVLVNLYPLANAGPDVSICASANTQLNGTASITSPNPIKVGTATAGDLIYPFNTYWHDARTQFIITAQELIQSGVPTGNITSIAFKFNTFDAALMNGFNISMKSTTINALTGYETGLTNVFSGTYAVPGLGWQTINFQTPFAWDGSSNIVFQVCFDNTAFTNYSTIDYRSTTSNRMAYYAADASVGCSFATWYLNQSVPIVKLGVTIPITQVWTPSTGLSATTTLNPTATPASTTNYTLSVSSPVGCTTTDQVLVTVQPLPVVSIANQTITSFCNGGSVVLTSTPAAQNYAWSQGATAVGSAASYTATTSGNYSLVVTNFYPLSGISCSSVPSNAITVTANPVPNTLITASGPTTVCQGGSVTLTASASNSTGALTYLWSNGATTPSITTAASGSYTVTITNVFGCSAQSTATTVNILPLPVATITPAGSTTFCAGGSVSLAASAGTSYVWTNSSATTGTINATLPGSYAVTVTSANGCSATSTPITVNVLAAPANAAISGPSALCVGNAITLSNPVSNGVWSSSNAAVLNVNASTGSGVGTGAGSATITYTTTGANGCTSAQTAAVSVTGTPVATISTSGATAVCIGGTVTLTASPAQSYLWNNNATTQSITVSNGGAYSVIISNGPGCSSAASAPTTVTINPLPIAAISANGSTVFCQGGSVNLTASGGTTYVWNNSGAGATGATLSANAAGSYSVTVTDANGCTATSNTVAVTVNALPTATITANGPTSFCQGGNVVLAAAGNGAISWTNNQNTPAITVSSSGNFAYTITDANGCSSTSTPTAVTVTALPVVPAIQGANSVCSGSTTVFTNPTSGGAWTSSNASIAAVDPLGSINGTGVGSATISYQLTANGCSATSTKVINVLANPVATVSAVGSTTFCIGSNVTLVSSPGVTYAWSNGATTQNVTLNTGGPITVQVTGTNGCSATSAPQTITVNPLPVLDPIAGASVVCAGSTGTLTNTTIGGTWSSANANVAVVNAVSGVVSGNTAGTANMTYAYTNANGCSASVSAPVVVQALPSTATTVAGSTAFCQGGSVTLTAPTSASYLWIPGGETTQSIAANASGSYAVQVSNGACSATSLATIVNVYALPAANISSASTTICQGSSVTLTAPPATSYAWSNGATTQSINVTSAGNYGVTVSNVYGCTNASPLTAISVSALPASFISAAGPTTFCNGSSVILSANSGTSYLWSNGATTQNITANASGNYFVTITNAAGCSAASNEIEVITQQTFTSTATAVGPTAVCNGAFVTLVASPGTSYLWSNGATTQGINAGVNGNYSVTVTDALGCTSTSANIPVSILPVPNAAITAGGATTFCQGGSVVLTGTGGNTYVWNSSTNGATLTATQSGTYVVTAYAANGCSDAAEVVVTVNPIPSPTLILNGNNVLCPGESVVISAQPNNTYAWSNNATTQSITVTTPGTYSAVLTGLNGCSTTSNAVNVTAGVATSSTINATSNSSYTLNEVVYTQSGTYTQILTNAAGCDSTITLNLTLTVGIEEGSLTGVTLYPNPTSESFTIKTSAPVYGAYSIYDAQGKLVFAGEMTGTETNVNISSVARGIYYLRVPELSEPLRVVKN